MLSSCRPSSRSSPRPGGFTLLEMLVALIMLGALTAILVPVIAAAHRQRQEVTRHQIVLAWLDDCCEQAADVPWDEFTSERLRQILEPGGDDPDLEGLTTGVVVDEIAEPVPARVAKFSARWSKGSERPSEEIRLSVWRPRQETPQ